MSSSIPSWQILTAHTQPFRGARDLAFCLKVLLDSLLVWVSSGGSGETAQMRRLAWTFAARIGDKYQIRLTRSVLFRTTGNNNSTTDHYCPVGNCDPRSTANLSTAQVGKNGITLVIVHMKLLLIGYSWKVKTYYMCSCYTSLFGIAPRRDGNFWAATWQSQQNSQHEPRMHPVKTLLPSPIRIFAVCLVGS